VKALVFGMTGQVARELQRRRGDAVLDAHGRETADFEDPAACAALVHQTDADVIINAVAYTAVDAAEDDAARAHRVNGDTPAALAEAAARRGLPLVHLSTDYVFDGSGNQPWSVDAPTAPLGAYGRSKLAGEHAIRATGGPHAILRTSWVVSAHGKNFVKTMLRLGVERPRLTIVADQIGGPTPAAAIADACFAVAQQLARDPGKRGTYHFTGAPDVSWAAFAREIFAQAGLACDVADIATSDYPTPAQRPLNSRLDNSLTHAVFGLQRPDWRAGLGDILTELGAM